MSPITVSNDNRKMSYLGTDKNDHAAALVLVQRVLPADIAGVNIDQDISLQPQPLPSTVSSVDSVSSRTHTHTPTHTLSLVLSEEGKRM
jgi:hypothetical protein